MLLFVSVELFWVLEFRILQVISWKRTWANDSAARASELQKDSVAESGGTRPVIKTFFPFPLQADAFCLLFTSLSHATTCFCRVHRSRRAQLKATCLQFAAVLHMGLSCHEVAVVANRCQYD